MPYLLNVAYILLLTLAWPWLLLRALRTGRYREGWGAKLLGLVPIRHGGRPCLWLHAVSVGEVNLLATLLAEIARRRPDWQCVVSTTTKTGYDLARKKYADHLVFYCPLDFTWATRRAMRRIRPDLLVLAELELWPNLIDAARRHGAPLAVVNGRLSPSSHAGYRRLGRLARATFRRLDLVAAQDDEYAARFRDLGARPQSVVVTGSLKFDGAQTDRAHPTAVALARLAGIEPADVIFLAGSTQQPEEALALAAFQALAPRFARLRLILVPRHPERFDTVARLLDQSGQPWQRRSRLEAEGPDPAARILLVDAVGELAAWWATAAVGFVGGSLLNDRGGQNMIEPAAYGTPVCFGPGTRNFRDVVARLLAADAAVVVHSGQELTAFVARVLEDPDWAAALGQRARRLVAAQLGATRRTLECLEALMPARGRAPPAIDHAA